MTNAIEEATAAIKHFADKEITLLSLQREKQEDLARAKEKAGAEFLDDGTIIGVDAVGRRQAELDTISHALIACRAKRLQAVQQKLDGEIQEFRARAADSQRQAEAIQAKTKEHFDAIKQLENADYSPTSQPASARLMSMSNLLARSADDLQRRGIATGGNIHLTGPVEADEVMRTVLEHASDGPSAQRILDWFAGHDQHAMFASHRLHVYLIWTAGLIDAASRIQVLELLEPPAAAPVEEPAVGSNLVSVNEFLGYAPKRKIG
jgi:hypothetical protein